VTAAAAAGLARLAEEAGTLEFATLPEAAVTQVERLVAGAIGAAVAGARRRPEIARLADRSAHAGDARLLVAGDRWADAGGAAFVNGCAVVALELDDGLAGGGHPGAHVIPAALATAQRCHRTGGELIAAVAAGYEITARLFRAFRPRYPAHPHGNLGTIGGAVAAARLRGTDPMAAAAIAAMLPVLSTWSPCFAGATARNAVVGLAGAVAVQAAELAGAGFTGEMSALEEAFADVAGERADDDALSEGIDLDRLAVHSVVTKRFSAAGPLHCAIEAAHRLRDVEGIEKIRVETVANNLKFARLPRPNDLSARFSLPYAVAAALRRDPRDVAAFDYDTEVAALAERVTVVGRPDLERGPGTHAARVTVTGRGGIERTATVTESWGGTGRPATDEDLAAEFAVRCGRHAAGQYSRLRALRELDDCAALFGGAL
jgi:2-methylcitrate dehydratase PrpD